MIMLSQHPVETSCRQMLSQPTQGKSGKAMATDSGQHQGSLITECTDRSPGSGGCNVHSQVLEAQHYLCVAILIGARLQELR